ncbi:MAG: epoxide hydrolase N-terminal domain-containing protein, partial [Rhodospirillaceae bacterium]
MEQGKTLSRRTVLQGGAAALPLASTFRAAAKAAEIDGGEDVPVTPFRIEVPDSELTYILDRVRDVRWPVSPQTSDPWRYGASLPEMKDLREYWLEEYDWRTQEAALNEFPHLKATIAGLDIHFVHVKGSGKNP